MGQIFYACAYDLESKTCCSIEADKFHANCFSFSGAVFSIHYLLRHAPYRIMWGGNSVISRLSDTNGSEEYLLGLSTYLDYEWFKGCHEELQDKTYYDKVKSIDENYKIWKRISVWDDAKKYFNWETTHSVDYSGYLVNHTQKLAIDIADYFEKSKSLTGGNAEFVIDLVPVLTETGGGSAMAFFDGISVDTTEEFAGKWSGDLLQIVDVLPADYMLINCCFAEIKGRSAYCYHKFGVNKDGLLLCGKNGMPFSAVKLNFYGKRGLPSSFIVEEEEGYVRYKPTSCPV